MEKGATRASSVSKTLFIRHLPSSVTNGDLLGLFKDYGPIKSCYVVFDPETKLSRGIGYVKFTDSDDAQKAIKAVEEINGTKIDVSFSLPKRLSQAKSKQKTQGSSTEGNVGNHKLIVRNLPFNITEDHLKSLFADIGNVLEVEIPSSEEGKKKGYGFVTLSSKKAGDAAISSLNHTEVSGRKLNLSWFVKQSDYNKVKKEVKPVRKAKTNAEERGNRNRLIIRNIPFNIAEKKLRAQLSKYGQVESIDIPTMQDGKRKGFAFVTYQSSESAQAALEQLETLSNRPVAVDWAVDKEEYRKQTQPAVKEELNEVKQEPEVTGWSDSESDSEMDEDEEEKAPDVKEEKEDEWNSGADEDEGDSEDASDESAEESDDDSGLDSEEDEDADSESGDDEDQSAAPDKKKKKKRKEMQSKSSDADQERTLFLRNVSYESTEESLEKMFSPYGTVKYVRIVMDHMTERSRGMAFVQFSSKEEAEACLQASQDPEKASEFEADGRQLVITLALNRNKIEDMQNKEKKEKKQPKDKRNLYLAREGLIRSGTQAAHGVSSKDMAKRMKLEMSMRAKLKNPLIFISPVRICIHNLPGKVTDKSLKFLCLKSIADKEERKSVKITECRVMKDLTRVNAEGKAKSRGYAFVTFTEHQHALAVLRHLNNNPNIFSDEKRPIVEFSLENIRKLQAKEKRQSSTKSLLTGNTKLSKDSASKTKPAAAGTKELLHQTGQRPEGVKPGLPSHFGPKVRHKARHPNQPDERKLNRLERKKQEKAAIQREKAGNRQPKAQKRKAVSDDFDTLVDNYRNKISTSVMSRSKNKWFD